MLAARRLGPLTVSALMLIFTPFELAAQNFDSRAWKKCQSEDVDEQVAGCTIVINANGFGSPTRLADAFDGRCRSLHIKRQYDLAIADCKAAIALRPSYFYAYNNLGAAYLGLSEYRNALAVLDKAIELKPNFLWSYLNRAKATIALGLKAEAMKDLQHALMISPANQEAREMLGQLSMTGQLPPVPPRVSSSQGTTPSPLAVKPKLASVGSGFVVNREGFILTNQHVIEECESIWVQLGASSAEATVVASDQANDLAAIQTKVANLSPLPFREGRAIRPGDEIVLVGFPYSGLLASAPNVSVGAVSALAGLRDDVRFLQISAPVQPGNSGGPLLDSSGNVVGVVVATMNVLAVLKVTGSVPQNVNFAVKASLARDFLDARGIRYETALSAAKVDLADVGERGSRSAVLVKCYKSL
jgi:S1-C subfamily serine protease